MEFLHRCSRTRRCFERDPDGDRVGVTRRGRYVFGAGDGSAAFEDGADIVGRGTAHETGDFDDVALTGESL